MRLEEGRGLDVSVPALPQRPRLAPGVTLLAETDDRGYLDTPGQVLQLGASVLGTFVKEVLPLLDGRRSLHEVEQVTSLAPEHLGEMLNFLAAHGALTDGHTTHHTDSGQDVMVCGDGPLCRMVTESLGVAAHPCLPDWEERRGRGGLTVAVGARAQDASLVRLNRSALQDDAAVLFVGVERGGLGFVGPLWLPSEPDACYACFQRRLDMNDVHGPTREAFGTFVERTGQAAAALPLPSSTAAHMAGYVAWQVGQWRRTGGGELVGAVTWFGAGDFERRREPLLPVPTCPACAGRVGPRRHQGLDLTAAVNRRTGIVHRVFPVAVEADDPPVQVCASTLSNVTLLDRSLSIMTNSGAGYTPAAALAASIGESLERYAAAFYDRGELVLSTHRALDGAALHPETLSLFSDDQYTQPEFGYRRFTPETPVRWVRATSWRQRTSCWVPAALVYLPYRTARGETRIVPSLSTGLAAGPTLEAAILSGVYEVLERDAVALSWLHRLPTRAVPPSLLTEDVLAPVIDPTRPRRYRVYDVTLDLPFPVCIAAIEHTDPSGRTLLMMGSACRADPRAAVRKALLEAAQSFSYMRGLLQLYRDWTPGEHFERVDSFQKHAVLYSRFPELRTRAGYLVDFDTPHHLPERPALDHVPAAGISPAQTLHEVVRVLHERGHQVLVVDLTTPDLHRVGVHVARVIVPGLVHLPGHHRYRFLGGTRGPDVVRRLGAGTPTNPFPHPFP